MQKEAKIKTERRKTEMAKTTNVVQVLLDDETLQKLNRIILIDALEAGESPKGKSQWLRELIEDTVNFPPTLKKIESYEKGR